MKTNSLVSSAMKLNQLCANGVLFCRGDYDIVSDFVYIKKICYGRRKGVGLLVSF